MILLILILSVSYTHKCIHNQVQSLYNIRYKRNDVYECPLRREISNVNLWEPIRIKILYDDNIEDSIKNLVEEIVIMFESLINVNRLHVGFKAFQCVIHETIQIEGYDLVFFITRIDNECSDTTLAYARICQAITSIKRTISVIVNICNDSPDLRKTLIHEFFHGFGISRNILDDTMVKRVGQEGRLVPKIYTPTALESVRTYFNCPSLKGVELELDGSHFKKKIYFDDLMSAVYTPDVVLSELPFKILHDMPFYKINLHLLNETVSERMWGKGLGCSFVQQSCLESYYTNPEYSPFCFNSDTQKCTFNNEGLGECIVEEYRTREMYDRYHYIDHGIRDVTHEVVDGRHLGGLDYMDYCPYYQEIESCGWNKKCFNLQESKCLEYKCDPGFIGIKLAGFWFVNCTCGEDIQHACELCSKHSACDDELQELCELCNTLPCDTIYQTACIDKQIVSSSSRILGKLVIFLIIFFLF